MTLPCASGVSGFAVDVKIFARDGNRAPAFSRVRSSRKQQRGDETAQVVHGATLSAPNLARQRTTQAGKRIKPRSGS